MRLLKVVASLVVVIGFFFLFLGLFMFFSLDRNMELMEEMQRAGMAREINVPVFRSIILKTAIQYVIVGILTTVSGVGIFFKKNWARRLWLAILVLMVLMGFYILATQYWRGVLDTSDIIGSSISGLFILAMFFYFTRLKTKSLFRRERLDYATES